MSWAVFEPRTSNVVPPEAVSAFNCTAVEIGIKIDEPAVIWRGEVWQHFRSWKSLRVTSKILMVAMFLIFNTLTYMTCQVCGVFFFFTVTIYDCPCLELQQFISYHWQTGNWIWPIFYTVSFLLFYILHGVTVIKSVYLRAFTCLNLQNLTINFHFKFIIRSYPVVIYRCVTSWSIVVLINRREGIMVKNVVLNVLFIETKKMSRTLKRSRPFIVMRVRSMRGSLRPLADQPNQVQSTRTECDSLNVLHR